MVLRSTTIDVLFPHGVDSREETNPFLSCILMVSFLREALFLLVAGEEGAWWEKG
jgi:hypothetical protein